MPAAVTGLLYSSMLLGAAPDKTVPAIKNVEPWQQVGQQPYELTSWRRRSPTATWAGS